jgi:hypothetical protein
VQPAQEAGPQEDFVSSPRLRRLAAVSTMALLATMVLGTGVTNATVASMEFLNPTKLPATVGPNALAGYSFTVHNGGSSNLSQLFLSAPGNGAAAYYHDSVGTTCQLTPTLKCAYGALNAGASILVTVAYQVGTSNFNVTFNLDTTGTPSTDGHHSHGDSVPQSFTTSVNSGKDFAGGFQLDGGTFTTNDTLGRKNDQSTSVHSDLRTTPVNVTDGITTFPGTGADPCATLSCVGDWTQVQVGTGSEGPIEVKILIYGQSVKGNPALSSFGLWHEGSTPNPITVRCTDPTSINAGNQECITVSMQGNNYLIDAWLIHNGTLRGLNG